MRTRNLSFGVALVVLSISTALRAQAPVSTSPAGQGLAAPTQAPKTVAGKWTMTIDTPIGEQTSLLTLALDNNKLTGSSTREDRQSPNPIAGALDGDAFTFSMTYEGGMGPLALEFEGKLQADGTLVGTATLNGMEPVKWWAKRAASGD